MLCLVGSARACVARASSPSVARIAAIPTSATPFAGLVSSLTATTFSSLAWSALPRWRWFFLHDRGASPGLHPPGDPDGGAPVRDRCFSRIDARRMCERSQGVARSCITVDCQAPGRPKCASCCSVLACTAAPGTALHPCSPWRHFLPRLLRSKCTVAAARTAKRRAVRRLRRLARSPMYRPTRQPARKAPPAPPKRLICSTFRTRPRFVYCPPARAARKSFNIPVSPWSPFATT